MWKRLAAAPRTRRKYYRELTAQWGFLLLAAAFIGLAVAAVVWTEERPVKAGAPIFAFFMFLALQDAFRSVEKRLVREKEEELKRLTATLVASQISGKQAGKTRSDALSEALRKNVDIEVFNKLSIWDFSELEREIVSELSGLD
jgi:hypothetical protein